MESAPPPAETTLMVSVNRQHRSSVTQRRLAGLWAVLTAVRGEAWVSGYPRGLHFNEALKVSSPHAHPHCTSSVPAAGGGLPVTLAAFDSPLIPQMGCCHAWRGGSGSEVSLGAQVAKPRCTPRLRQ